MGDERRSPKFQPSIWPGTEIGPPSELVFRDLANIAETAHKQFDGKITLELLLSQEMFY